jgi:beta-phosphoglucomutase-like phosphatase (HAD superfamily)
VDITDFLLGRRLTHLVNVATPSEDAEQSKPTSDIFQVALKQLDLDGHEAVAINAIP